VPPAERSPEVAGFVESVQLLCDARELLPLTTGGKAALPFNPAMQQKVCTGYLGHRRRRRQLRRSGLWMFRVVCSPRQP
jgi:hypothetical protein